MASTKAMQSPSVSVDSARSVRLDAPAATIVATVRSLWTSIDQGLEGSELSLYTNGTWSGVMSRAMSRTMTLVTPSTRLLRLVVYPRNDRRARRRRVVIRSVVAEGRATIRLFDDRHVDGVVREQVLLMSRSKTRAVAT
jgi:hypothetical protein